MFDTAEFYDLTRRLVVDPMTEFIEECDGEGYTHEEIQKCEALVHSYLDTLAALAEPDNDAIMAAVEEVILALNDLNEATDYCLIETGEREALCEVIQTAAEACGLTDAPEDVTEEWRDW